jgi:hypothetical protein
MGEIVIVNKIIEQVFLYLLRKFDMLWKRIAQ